MKNAVSVRLFAVLLAASGAGCETAKQLWEQADKPTASVKSVALRELTLEGVVLAFDVEVGNPYGTPLPVAALDLSLSSRGQGFLNAQSLDQGTVPARGSRLMPLTAKVGFAPLLAALSGVRPGAVVPYAAELGVSVDAPVAGRLRLPVKHEGELPVPAVPDVAVKDVRWKSLSLGEATAAVRLEIGNPNQFPFDLSALDYALTLGGVKVAETKLAATKSFAPGGKVALELPFTVKPADLGTAAFALFRGEGAKYGFQGGIAAKTAFGDLRFPVAAAGDTPFSR
jgi:LEA14-like dessication related protein